ncbi:hypothetical protein B0T17DRAFT_98379 [Bombardia bombarda]|uniref:FAD/NAD(P)-binding domain-containing protein n=1 Tax=Bombardia bombarda TaxID=252184 RepID=A0AA39XN59_9PEZI|nr:hypothetical protein B0T17DRAFT_98379 [Bombardia bombarda]
MAKTVLILGGAYAGLHVAHALLKKQDPDVKVVLVSKISHMYWNMASVRAVVPGQLGGEDLVRPLSTALSRYPSTSYEIVIGSADSSDFDAKTVTVTVTANGTTRTIAYDQLVLATGSRCPTDNVPWKANGSYDSILDSINRAKESVKNAKQIVIAGSGYTGIELAGELGYEYQKDGSKTITLLSADADDKSMFGGDMVAPALANELRKLKVNIRHSVRVVDARKQEGPEEKWAITLEGGEQVTADAYFPTMGLVPNTEYINAKHLSESKTVVVDEYLRVSGAPEGTVWAAGDIVSKPRAGFMITQKQATTVAKNVELALKGKPPVVHKGMPMDVIACATGRGRGAGRIGSSIKMPSLMVWAAKGRTLGLNYLKGYVDGSVA